MVKIKEVGKVKQKIKEIKKEKESELEEDVEKFESEEFANFITSRRRNVGSTLDEDGSPQTVGRLMSASKEDANEINFRPSYVGGGNPYQDRSYASAPETGRADTSLISESRDNLQRPVGNNVDTMGMAPRQQGGAGAGRPETESERKYIAERKERSRDDR